MNARHIRSRSAGFFSSLLIPEISEMEGKSIVSWKSFPDLNYPFVVLNR